MFKITFLVLISVEVSMGCYRWPDDTYTNPPITTPTTPTTPTTTILITTTPTITCKPKKIYVYGNCYLRCEYWEEGRFKRYPCEPPSTTTPTTTTGLTPSLENWR